MVDNNKGTWLTRGIGLMQTLGGVLEIAGGAGAMAVPEPTMLTKVAGVALLAHGSDTFTTGIRTLWYGRVEHSLTQQAATATAAAAGASPEVANGIGVGVDIVAGIGPGTAIQIERTIAMRAAESSATRLAVSSERLGQSIQTHTRLAISEGGNTQWWQAKGAWGVAEGASFGMARAPRAPLQVASVAVDASQARAATVAAEQLAARGPFQLGLLGPNCSTTARDILTESGIATPAWSASPPMLPIGVAAGYGITAVGGGTAAAAPLFTPSLSGAPAPHATVSSASVSRSTVSSSSVRAHNMCSMADAPPPMSRMSSVEPNMCSMP